MDRKHTWLFVGSLVLTVITFYPQLTMWATTFKDWQHSFAQVQGDEWLYSAYVASLIDGRPRRNDPYTGQSDTDQLQQPESQFSIQFIPAYLIAVPARLLGLSASGAFIALALICPFLSCLAIYWLFSEVTGDRKFGITAAIMVLSFGALVAGEGAISYLGASRFYIFVPFLRRYEPAAMFPLLFVFCGFVWKSLTSAGKASWIWTTASGAAFVVLVFSYFYLWTTAAAWLCTVAVIRVALGNQRAKDLGRLGAIALMAVVGLIPYAVLLTHRSKTMDESLLLSASRHPDLFRAPEVFVILSIVVLAVVFRKTLNLKENQLSFGLSFTLVPFLVFNQQIITGLSLKPYHYEMLTANYMALTGIVLVSYSLWKTGRKSELPSRVARRLIVVALWWLALEMVLHTNAFLSDSHFANDAARVGNQLKVLSKTEIQGQTTSHPRPLVCTTDPELAVMLPTFSPQALLWSPNFTLSGLPKDEVNKRFFLSLYYSGVDGEGLERILNNTYDMITAFAFGPGRNVTDSHAKSITQAEIAAKLIEYQSYCSSLTLEEIAKTPLSYFIQEEGADLKNIDRWYEREPGQRLGRYVLYRVRLRRKL